MSNEIRKNGKVYSSTGPMDHEQLKNRLGVGQYGEAYHLNIDEYRYVQATMAGAPLAPVNISPADGELNIYQYPEFVGSAYRSPRDTPMLGLEILICSDAEMTNTIYQGYAETAQTSARFQDFEALIAVDTTYFWSVRYVDIEERRGNWSPPTSFTTAAAFEPTVVLRPQILYPQEGDRVPPIDPIFISSFFMVEGAADSHASTDWQLANHADFDPAHILAESLDDAVNRTSITFGGIDLSGQIGTYARVRHEGATAGKSQWSPIRHALLKQFHDDYLIGVGITEGGIIYNIDDAGNAVYPRTGYYETHPLFQFPQVIKADQYMRALPEVHVRCDHDEGGFKYRYWISPLSFSGSMVHPAFELSPNGPILYGEYPSGSQTDSSAMANLNSAPGMYLRTVGSNAIPDTSYLNTNTDSDHRGWGLMSIYERALLSLLMIIEFRTMRLDSKMNGNVPNNMNNVSGLGSYHGMVLAFMNRYFSGSGELSEALSGISLSTGYSTSRMIGAPTDLSLFIEVNRVGMGNTGATVSTIRTDIHPDLGPLQLLFLPDTINAGGLNLPLGYQGSGSSWVASYSSSNATAVFPMVSAASSYSTAVARLVRRSTT